MLVASMNPCPCGFYNHPEKDCVCSAGIVQKYLNRISGPLLDRIDIHIEVVPVPFDKLSELRPSEPSAAVRKRVTRARNIQTDRFQNYEGIHSNAQLTPALMREHCSISDECSQMLKNAMDKLGLSARAYDRIHKVNLKLFYNWLRTNQLLLS
jgi:magnesium chelatase family protein